MRVLRARRPARRAVVLVFAVVAVVGVSLAGLIARRSGASARADPLRPAAPAASASAAAAPPTEPSPALLPTERATIQTAAGLPVHAYPPVDAAATAAEPLVVMLHGMCSHARRTCDFWSRAGREGSWLVCPEGNGVCGGAADWVGDGEAKATSIDQGLAAVERAYGAHIDHTRGDVLVGFSRGAFVARDVIYARPGRYSGAILIGAELSPDPARFKAAGIRRVVLAAGDYDGARPMMQRAAARLSAGGVPARYLSLGRIGHQLPRDFEQRMREALRWVRGGGGEGGAGQAMGSAAMGPSRSARN